MSEAAHTHHHSHKKLYITIFFALAILTAIEIYIPGIHGVSKFAKGVALISLAIWKAFLVAYYFMHLNEEKAWLKFIAAIPISAAAYAAMVILESMYR